MRYANRTRDWPAVKPIQGDVLPENGDGNVKPDGGDGRVINRSAA